MPIPFILGGLALATAVLGAGAHLSASEKKDEAKKIYRNSNNKQDDAGKKLESTINQTTQTTESLGLLKLNIQKQEIAKFLSVYQKLKALNLKSLQQEKIDFKELSPEVIVAMEKTSMAASEVLGAGVTSLASGVLAGAGVYGGVMSLGAASTGTAIASLSGVAATNATLAWLGGGALAAGGGGMALGTAVLGGLVAGPAILVSGFFADNKADEALTKAKEFEADVDIACEKMETQISNLQAIQVRCGEFKTVLTELRNRINPQLTKLESIVNELAIDPTPSENQLKKIHLTFLLAKTLKDVLDLNILDKQGALTSESKNVQQKLIAIGA